MGSSGGGDSSGLMALLSQARAGTPMPGLPVAGSENAVGDPFEYGKYQNFLPEPKATGVNDMATGLRPEMFQYKSPSGVVDPEIQSLRDELARLKAAGSAAPAPAAAPAGNPQWAALRASMSPEDIQIFQRSVSPAEFQAFMSA